MDHTHPDMVGSGGEGGVGCVYEIYSPIYCERYAALS